MEAWVRFAVVAVVAIACTTLAGWTLGSTILVSVVPGLVAMNPVTALMLIVTALGLWSVRRPADAHARRRIWVCGAIVVAVGAQRLVAYLIGSDTALDRLLFSAALDATSEGPNRMAPNTAASFVCSGLALLCLGDGRRRARQLASGLAIVTAFTAALTVVGYAYRSDAFVRLPRHIPMALNTAVAFGLLASGMLVARTDSGLGALLTSTGAGGAWARRLLPSAIVVPLAIGWLHLQAQRADLFENDFGVALMAVSTVVVLVAMLWWSARSLNTSDRVRADTERALHASEERLRAILDNALSVVFVKDLSGRLQFVNRRFEDTFHLSRAEVEGRTDRELFPAEVADAYRANDLRALACEARIEVEEQAILDDGPHVYETVKFPVRDANGGIVGICGMATDITGRRRAEGETARLQARIALTNRLLELMATRRDPDVYAAILDIVRAVFESPVGLVGYLDEDGTLVCVAAPPRDDQLGPSRMPRQSWGALLAATLDEGRSAALEVPHVLVTTMPELARSLIAPITYQGTPIGVLHVADRDREYQDADRALLETLAAALAPALSARRVVQHEEAERRRADAELRRVNAELAASNGELEAFTYSVSHDLRAPLRAIDGYARMLMEDHGAAFDGDARRLLDVVSDNARHMARLIDDLLALSRVGRCELGRTAVDMTALARSVAAEICAVESERRVDVRISALPAADGDATLLRQVYANLIGNAVKFTRGKPTAAIEIGCAAGPDEETTYFVRDDGAGFDMQYVDKVFEVFERLHDRRDFEGTGVGLAIVERIIRRHGGRVWAEGKVGEGATFFFTLPIAQGGSDARES